MGLSLKMYASTYPVMNVGRRSVNAVDAWHNTQVITKPTPANPIECQFMDEQSYTS